MEQEWTPMADADLDALLTRASAADEQCGQLALLEIARRLAGGKRLTVEAMRALLGSMAAAIEGEKSSTFLFPSATKPRKPVGRPKKSVKTDLASVMKLFGDAHGWTPDERNPLSPRQRQRVRAQIAAATGRPGRKPGRPKKSDKN